MDFNIEYEQEEDGRWLAEVIELPGVLTYGESADKAMVKVEELTLKAVRRNSGTPQIAPHG